MPTAGGVWFNNSKCYTKEKDLIERSNKHYILKNIIQKGHNNENMEAKKIRKRLY